MRAGSQSPWLVRAKQVPANPAWLEDPCARGRPPIRDGDIPVVQTDLGVDGSDSVATEQDGEGKASPDRRILQGVRPC